MWCPLFLVLLAGAATAEHLQAWKTDTEYQYAVRGRTLSALHDVADQYSGIIMRALLTIQPKSDGTLEAKVTKARYAQIHTKLPGGWNSEIPDHKLEMKQFPMSEKVFEIKMKHGVVRDLIVDKDVPTWEVNVLKSIVSQLQVDTQGENLMASKYNQEPEDEGVTAMFKTMEDTVGGRCEVLYDINPLPEFVLQKRPELVPMPDIRGDGEIIDIVKTKNYSNCEQRSGYHFGIPGTNKWEPSSGASGNFLSRSSVSRVIVTGNLKSFTIQSSVSTNKVILSPNFHENRKGMVSSRVNVTLVKIGAPSTGDWSTPANPESTGNLVYNYNNPFAGVGEDRRASRPQDNRNSEEKVRSLYNLYRRNRINDNDDDSSASDSSKSAKSLESNEEQLYWQPKPTLNEAPAMAMLPFFIGNHGKSIHKTDEIEPITMAKTLASQIGSDFQDPNSITDEQTLEKFTLLVRIIRTMSTQQIAEAERDLYQSNNEIDPHDESQSVRRGTWAAFRDAVAQAGTAPALVTITLWIKQKKIRGVEAASVVGVLAKTARTPTREYIDVFFELATMPETIHEPFLNTTALFTFSELVRYSQMDNPSSHTRYPVHTFGRFSDKINPEVFRMYVPYLAEKLKTSIEKNENAKAHTYIVSLGNIAHPKILAVFEPYLEGKMPASTFQRLLMVISLNKLATLKPKLARGVFYRIYKNTGEAHQLRCAAVTALMSTNPPASMLQRMAEFTNEDHSKHVNAAVKSAIESASELETPQWQELAENARNAKPLLNKESYGFEYSKLYLTDFIEREMNVAYQAQASFISSDDSYVPEALFVKARAIFGGFTFPRTSAGAMVSSAKDLLSAFEDAFKGEKTSHKHSHVEFSPENVAKLLKIKSEPNEDVEGAFMLQSAYNNKFMSLDKNTLKNLPELSSKALKALKDGHHFNTARIESYEMTMSFPMESGFPFVYTMKVPSMLKLAGSVKGDSNEDSLDGHVHLRAVYSVQFQSKLGFVTPFEHQHYMAGINKNYQAYVPLRVNVNYEDSDKRVTLKIQPIEQNEKFKLWHHSVVPFTSRHDILKMSPVLKDKETQKIITEEVSKNEYNFGSDKHGVKFTVLAEADNDNSPLNFEDAKWERNPLTQLFHLFVEQPVYHKVDIFMQPSKSSEQSIILSTAFETLQDDTTKYDEDRSKHIKAEAPKVENKKLNDPQRRRKLLKEAAKGIAAADAFAVDIGLEYPGQAPVQAFATLAFASSEVDEKSRGLVYWRLTDAGNDFEFESCTSLEARSPRTSDFGKDMLDQPEFRSRKFDIDLRYGQTCEKGYKVEIQGSQEQTEKYRDTIKRLPTAIECIRAAKKGMKSLPACHDVSVKMTMLDKTRITIKYDKDSREMYQLFDDYLDSMSDADDDLKSSKKRLNAVKDDDKAYDDTVKIAVDLSPNDNNGRFSYESDFVKLEARDVPINGIGPLVNVHPDLETAERLDMDMSDEPVRQRICVLDSHSATTFDESTYPINLGKCWHVVMTTFPKTNKNSGSAEPIDEDMALSILVRDAGDKKKDIKVTLGDKELQFSHADSKNKVTLDGKKVDLSEKRSYRHKNGKDIDFEVLQRPDGTLGLVSSKYDIDAWYDGQRVQIKASGKYRSDIRGLCGNFDGEPDNDFTSPKDCVLLKPEEFAASYALTTKDCHGSALEHARKASQAVCSQKSPRPGNVVSDRDAGRKYSENSNWGYHSRQNSDDEQGKNDSSDHKRCNTLRTKVIEEEDQICFSLRPLPTCAEGCTANRTKPKVMPMHCMPKNIAAERMADRIKQGANPDFSQKSYTKKNGFDIPVGCHAA
uniref:Vitellogenin n=1 Tax=Pimpla nipponica TaxID=67752 RepID=O17428_9HYME|nr:vitellogenin [Pimpla nipponica]